MYTSAKEQQEKNSFLCKSCLGEGEYLEEVETTKFEPHKKYEQRIREWEENVKNDPSNNY